MGCANKAECDPSHRALRVQPTAISNSTVSGSSSGNGPTASSRSTFTAIGASDALTSESLFNSLLQQYYLYSGASNCAIGARIPRVRTNGND